MSGTSGRFSPDIGNLRRHATRGTVLTAGFAIGFAALGLLQRLTAAAFLTTEEFGFWAVVLTILVTLSWLKQLGIADKYIQQEEPDQEAAWQKAFTLELLVSLGFYVLVALVVPLYAIGYDNADIIFPTMVCALAVPLTAFESATWISYRRLEYLRNRVLSAVDPLVSFVVTVVLAVAGAGYWSFVLGVVAGAAVGAVVCVLASPYRLRLRIDRDAVRSYASFSLPLFGSGVIGLIIVQGSLLAANSSVGLAGIGAIGLAIGIATFADRVDGIVSNTLYPAVCAVVDKTALMYEVFVKSNRIALMWGLSFGVGLALFAEDFIEYLFSEDWAPAAGLLAAIGLTAGVGQVAFNWGLFVRAVGDTRPLFVSALGELGTFLVVTLPAILTLGLTGWAIGLAVALCVQLVIRSIYMRRLFPGFNILAQFARAAAPILPGVALVLLSRLAMPDGRSAARAVAEVAVYAGVTIACTLALERPLVREVAGYMRRAAPLAPAPRGPAG